MLLAISNKKTIAHKLLNGSVNSKIVSDFIINDVIKGNKNMIIHMDNARTHHTKLIKKAILETDNKIAYNVPYHPEYSSVEYINNVIKSKLKKKYRNNLIGMENELDKIIRKIQEKVYKNCFTHAYTCILK
jgi:transposase